ncbi:hypothetical protein F5Y03DRAFT_364004 [Xylaria venustula]|nr:hypothetical protein F5Y03DRAFT_364004 [Xylaria venustula]
MTATSLLSLPACFIAAFAAYRLYMTYRTRLAAQQHGCQSATRYKHKDPIFGLDIFLRTGDAITKNQFLVEHQRRYDTYGHTFEALNFGSRAIYSVHPENIRAVFSKNAAAWDLSPPTALTGSSPTTCSSPASTDPISPISVLLRSICVFY